jgi:hypothetical protein
LKVSSGLKFLHIQAAVPRERWKKPFLAFFGPDVEKHGFRLPTFFITQGDRKRRALPGLLGKRIKSTLSGERPAATVGNRIGT